MRAHMRAAMVMRHQLGGLFFFFFFFFLPEKSSAGRKLWGASPATPPACHVALLWGCSVTSGSCLVKGIKSSRVFLVPVVKSPLKKKEKVRPLNFLALLFFQKKK
jgi:hypothetical protein